MKNTKLFYGPILALFTLFMVSCGSDKKEEGKEDDSGISINVDGDDGKANIKIGEDGIKIDVNDGDGGININTKDLEEGMNKLFGGKKVPVVNFREFKKLFPEKVAGLKRTSMEGSKTGFGGFKSSVATAEYGDGETEIKISIIDTGGMGMAVAAIGGWTNLEIDNESDNSYERTTMIDGHRAFVSYDSDDKDGQIAIFAKDRVFYTIDIDNGTEDMLKKAQDAVDIDDIIELIDAVKE